MSVSEFFASLVSSGLLSGVFALGFVRLLPTRHPCVIGWSIFCTSVFLNTVAERYVSAPIAMLMTITAVVVLPCLMFEGSMVLKIVAIVVSNVCELFAEFLAFAIWSMLAGIDIPEDMGELNEAAWAHVPEFVAAILIGGAVLWLALSFLRVFLGRFWVDRETRPMWCYLVFLSIQIVLLLSFALVGVMVDLAGASYLVLSLLILACFLVDLLLVVAMERHSRKLREDERARVLQQSLRDYLARFEPVVHEVSEVSKTRHDLRNHVQTVLELFERGLIGEARSHLALCRENLEATMTAGLENEPSECDCRTRLDF